MGFHLISGKEPNLWLGKFGVFDENLFVHGVSTRHGGVSKGCFDSLNLGLHVEDVYEDVIENRKRFSRGTGVDFSGIVTCQQVHGSKVVRVGDKDKGAGLLDFSTAIPDTDALITNEPGLSLMLFFADCTPILIADPVHKAVGLAHGGWKGTVGSIARKTVEAMNREFGSQPEDMVAAIAPSIGKCCYYVGEEVAEKFKAAFPDFADEILTKTPEGIKLDLQLCNTLQLQKAGLKAENIENAHACTACNNRQFFSYRADKQKTGRIAAIISVR